MTVEARLSGLSRQELESLFLDNLGVIQRILAMIERRHRLSRDAAAEFGAWVNLRLIENDYAVLAKFRGESSLPTYLSVALAMLYREYRVQAWGRWRPSAAGRRAGPLGIRLEILVVRDGLRIDEAGQLLRTSGETTLSDRELAAMASQFPRRPPLRPVEAGDPPVDVQGNERADAAVDAAETASEAATTQRVIEETLRILSNEDRLIVHLHYLEGMRIADIARSLVLPQKPLYRRIERALALLRAGLERAGISRERVRELAAGLQ
jgi:RNA polymerase sigma factor (sigma-70 family)